MNNRTTSLVGAWRVTAYDDRASVDEPWTASYGENVDGLIIYDPSGWMSVSVTDGTRFDAYFGRFQVIRAEAADQAVVGVVNNELLASSIPELLSLDQSRPFRVTGKTLMLGDGETWRRVCERMSDR